MEIGDFEKIIEDKETEQIASSILKEDIKQISRICEQWGENEDEVREYNVYIITTASKKAILKKQRKSSQIYIQNIYQRVILMRHICMARWKKMVTTGFV